MVKPPGRLARILQVRQVRHQPDEPLDFHGELLERLPLKTDNFHKPYIIRVIHDSFFMPLI
ncbi:hypothetical protein EVA_05210 [gut metagenome]|uniref:Uncharacterized protein n=1 Tax=gut metagenome TaxID=749906 RepID=J9GV04_9ZZZZ